MERLDFFFNWKFRPPRGLGPSIEISGKQAQHCFLGITWQPLARFSQIPFILFKILWPTLFFWKFSLTWGLGPSMQIWGKWAQNGFCVITMATTCQIFTYNPSFDSKFHEKDWTFLYWKFRPPRGLGLSMEIWGKQAQNYFLGATWQPIARFS